MAILLFTLNHLTYFSKFNSTSLDSKTLAQQHSHPAHEEPRLLVYKQPPHPNSKGSKPLKTWGRGFVSVLCLYRSCVDSSPLCLTYRHHELAPAVTGYNSSFTTKEDKKSVPLFHPLSKNQKQSHFIASPPRQIDHLGRYEVIDC